jgi:tetratricopeptide (TPR) repeat protein
MKIVVYAISKNEEKFVNRWVNSMQEADEIYVLDTGSTDNTVKLLKENKVHVKQKEIKPWRFDKARNESLKMIPKDTDICVCTDLDEVFNPGWRKTLENIWQKNTNNCQYIYNWSLDDLNKPIVSFYYNKIHDLKHYKWINPVHEVLNCSLKKEKIVKSDKIILNHYPDNTKSRASYLPLLELSVKENPNNDRNMHYLGREYMYYGKWNDAIDTLIKHLHLPTSLWKDERCASMRFIGRCYMNLSRYDEAEFWFNKAIYEAPYLRDPYMEKAMLFYKEERWEELINVINEALSIKEHEKTYINEPFSWNETPYDLLSIGYYNTKQYNLALESINKAIEINNNDERLKNNKIIICNAQKDN